jgi:hypothetical protein
VALIHSTHFWISGFFSQGIKNEIIKSEESIWFENYLKKIIKRCLFYCMTCVFNNWQNCNYIFKTAACKKCVVINKYMWLINRTAFSQHPFIWVTYNDICIQYWYSEACLSWTLNKVESFINWTLIKSICRKFLLIWPI